MPLSIIRTLYRPKVGRLESQSSKSHVQYCDQGFVLTWRLKLCSEFVMIISKFIAKMHKLVDKTHLPGVICTVLFIQIDAHARIDAHPPSTSSSRLTEIGEIDNFCIKDAWNLRRMLGLSLCNYFMSCSHSVSYY